jgi:hypothetical protein
MKRSTLYALLLLGIVLLPFLIGRSSAAGQLHVTVLTDKETYGPGELISIQGQVFDESSTSVPFASVSIQANDPDGKPVHVAILLSSADGSYSDQFAAPPNSVNGGYTIYVTASKPGYTDAYSQAACIITPEFLASHMPWLALFLIVLALLLARRRRKSSKIAFEMGRPSTDSVLSETATPFQRRDISARTDCGGSEADSSEFEKRLQKAIDESLALFGHIGKHNSCVRLKEVFDHEPRKMAADPERLSSALDEMLGRAGQVIGRAIAHKVAATYSIELRQDHDLTYADHIRHLMQVVRNQSLQTPAEAGEVRLQVRKGVST